MRVSYFNFEGRQVKNIKRDTFASQKLNKETIQLVVDSIIYNSNPKVEFGQENFVPRGNDIEVGLMKFL